MSDHPVLDIDRIEDERDGDHDDQIGDDIGCVSDEVFFVFKDFLTDDGDGEKPSNDWPGAYVLYIGSLDCWIDNRHGPECGDTEDGVDSQIDTDLGMDENVELTRCEIGDPVTEPRDHEENHKQLITHQQEGNSTENRIIDAKDIETDNLSEEDQHHGDCYQCEHACYDGERDSLI